MIEFVLKSLDGKTSPGVISVTGTSICPNLGVGVGGVGGGAGGVG